MYQSALIGLGNIAWKLGRDNASGSSLCHKDAIDQNPKTNLLCAYSPNQEEAHSFTQQTGLKGYTDLKKMLTDEQLDLVSICSPNENHDEHLSLCCEHAIPMVWLEKPAASSTEKIITIEAFNKNQDKPSSILVNFQRRYTECYKNLRKLIANKQFGKPLSIEIHYSRGLETNGSHMLDMIFFLFEETPYQIFWCETGNNLQNPNFVLRLDNNVLVHVIGTDTSYHNIDIAVTCETGRLNILHGGMTLNVEQKIEHELFPGFFRLKNIATDDLGKAGFDMAFDKALTDLIDSHEKNRTPQSNLSTAIQGQKLLEEVLALSNQ